MTMGKCEDGQRKSFYNETNYELFQGWYGRLQFPWFMHAMDFFKEHASSN
jgi:hypothetical protein